MVRAQLFDGLETQETCTQYNALKVARAAFLWTGDARFADLSERLILNGILGAQRPAVAGGDSGGNGDSGGHSGHLHEHHRHPRSDRPQEGGRAACNSGIALKEFLIPRLKSPIEGMPSTGDQTPLCMRPLNTWVAHTQGKP